MGSLHACAHIISAFSVALASIYFVLYLTTWTPNWDWVYTFTQGAHVFNFDLRIVLTVVFILIGGYLIGSFIQGLYLLISLNIFGRHFNEAFSTIAVEDWKSFLKLHIDRNGDLRIYPIGIKRVPRRWKRNAQANGAEVLPDYEHDRSATEPQLIEPPIVLKSTTASVTGVIDSKKL